MHCDEFVMMELTAKQETKKRNRNTKCIKIYEHRTNKRTLPTYLILKYEISIKIGNETEMKASL